MRKGKAVQLLLFFSLLPGTLLFAKPKEKVFNNSPQQVFEAALQTAREKHVVSYIDDTHMMFAFATGMSFASNGFNCNASVESLGEGKSELIINVQGKDPGKFNLGAGGRMADDFFVEVAKRLEETPQK